MAVIARASFFSIGFLLWKNTPPTSHRAHVRFPTACRLKFHQLDQDVHQSLPTAHTVLPRVRGHLVKQTFAEPMLVDSHCHLDFPDFSTELDALIGRARAVGIGRIVTISTRVKRHAQVLAIAEKFPEVFCSVGTHPHYAHEELD